MSNTVAICPISDDCPWEAPDQRDVHAHIVVDHPEVLRSPADQRTSGKAYKEDVRIKYRRIA